VEFPNVDIEKKNIVGTSQGSTLSPILANILLHELDLYMSGLIIESNISGSTSKVNPAYKKLHDNISNLRQAFLPS